MTTDYTIASEKEIKREIHFEVKARKSNTIYCIIQLPLITLYKFHSSSNFHLIYATFLKPAFFFPRMTISLVNCIVNAGKLHVMILLGDPILSPT